MAKGKIMACIEFINPDVAGQFSDGQVTLYADNINPGEAFAVFLHEAGEHAGLADMLGPEKYAQLKQQFERLAGEGNAYATQAVERVPGDTPAQHVPSERLAYLIEAVTNDVEAGRNAVGLAKARMLVNRVIAAVRAWAFDKLPEWITKGVKLGPEDFQALAVRAARSWVASGSAYNASIDGRRLSVVSSAFKRWFGDSQVVDANNNPLVVYHGTDSNFSEFNIGQNGVAYFSPNKDYRYMQGSDIVMPVYLSAQSLYQAPSQSYIESLRSFPEKVKDLKAKGYDGVIWSDPKNIMKGGSGWGNDYAQIAVFSANQIKSATGNNSKYDKSNADIRFSRKAPPSEGLSDSADNNMWADIDRAAPKEGTERAKELVSKSWEWVKNNAGEFSKRGFLPLTTLRQLVEIGAERAGLRSAQAYMARVEQMLTRRNQMQDEAAQLAQRWMKLEKRVKHRLAWVMHEATKAGVDPSDKAFKPAEVSIPGGLARIEAELAEDYAGVTAAKQAGEADETLNYVAATAENLQMLNQIKLRRQRKVKALATSRASKDTFELAKDGAERAADNWRRLKNAKLSSDKRAAAFPRLAKYYQQLPADAQQVFQDARDLYEQRFSETQSALEASIEKAELGESQKAGLLQKIRADFESARLQGAYFPLFRQGDYFVFGERERKFAAGKTQYRKNPQPVDEIVDRATGEVSYQVRGDGRRFATREAAELDAGTWATEENARASMNSRADLVGKDLVAVRAENGEGWILEDNPVEKVFSMVGTAREAEQLKAEWQRDGLSNVRFGVKSAQETQDRLAEVSAFAGLLKEMEANGQGVDDEVYQAYLQVLPDLSMRKNFIHRKGTAGYAEDALQAFSHSMMHQAHQISKLEARDDLKQLLDDVFVQSQEAPQDQALLAGNVREELKKRHDWVMNPTNARWTNWTSSFGFFMYLGVSPAAALVNLTQTAVMAYPALAAEYGWGAAGKEMRKAVQQLSVKETLAGDDAIDRTGLSRDELQAFQDWHDEGVIDKSMAHMLAGIGDSDSLQNSPTYQKWMERVAHLFHKAEIVNREVTLLTGYRLARAAGKSHAFAIKQAADITWASQFDYSNANRAAVMQNDFAKLALMFKSYSQHMIYFMLKNASDWGKGGAEGKKAQARLLGMLGVTLAMGGVSALPLGMVGLATAGAYSHARYGATKTAMATAGLGLAWLAAALFDDEDDPTDWEAEMRAALREMGGKELETLVFRGGVNMLTGVDISSRINLSDLLLRDSGRETDARGEKLTIYENMAGPVVGYAVNAVTDFPALISEGKEWRAFEKLVPKFARDYMKAGRYGVEGVENYGGDDILAAEEQLNLWHLFWQSQGFTPERVSRAYGELNDAKNYDTRLANSKKRIMQRYYVAYIEKDRDGMQEAMERAKRWNATNKGAAPITWKKMQASLKARLRSDRQAFNGGNIRDRWVLEALGL